MASTFIVILLSIIALQMAWILVRARRAVVLLAGIKLHLREAKEEHWGALNAIHWSRRLTWMSGFLPRQSAAFTILPPNGEMREGGDTTCLITSSNLIGEKKNWARESRAIPWKLAGGEKPSPDFSRKPA